MSRADQRFEMALKLYERGTREELKRDGMYVQSLQSKLIIGRDIPVDKVEREIEDVNGSHTSLAEKPDKELHHFPTQMTQEVVDSWLPNSSKKSPSTITSVVNQIPR